MKVRLTGKNVVYTLASLGGGFLMLFDMKLRFYYIDVLHFDPMMISWAMIAFAVWNAINDPLLGFLSDRTKTRMGRRIPYILFSSVPLALSFWLMFSPPMALLKTPAAQIVFFFIIICLFDTFFTAIYLNWEALFPEMFRDEKVRNRISMFKQGGGIVGAVVATLAAPIVIDRLRYPAMGVIFGAATAASVLLSLIGSHEDRRYSEAQSLNMLKAVKATFTNTAFLNVVFASICFETAKQFVLANVDFFGKYVIRDAAVSALALPIVFAVSIVSFPVWMLLNRKGRSERIVLCSLATMFAGLLSLQFVQSFVQMIPGMALMGFSIAGYFMGRELLFARSIEYDYCRMGERREGAYFGVNALIIRLSGTLVSYLMGRMLADTGYNSFLDVQPGSALLAIRSLMGLIPAVLLAAGFVVSFFYPLKGARYEAVLSANADKDTAIHSSD